jgi:hypothetical protein
MASLRENLTYEGALEGDKCCVVGALLIWNHGYNLYILLITTPISTTVPVLKRAWTELFNELLK